MLGMATPDERAQVNPTATQRGGCITHPRAHAVAIGCRAAHGWIDGSQLTSRGAGTRHCLPNPTHPLPNQNRALTPSAWRLALASLARPTPLQSNLLEISANPIPRRGEEIFLSPASTQPTKPDQADHRGMRRAAAV